MNNSSTFELGYLNAHITGDFRYNAALKVLLNKETKTVTIVVQNEVPSGGMDSDTAAFKCTPKTLEVKELTAKAVLAAAKKMVKDDSILAEYGKPSKKFRWAGKGEGLSVGVVEGALKVALG